MLKILSIILLSVNIAAASSWQAVQERLFNIVTKEFAQEFKPIKSELEATIKNLPHDEKYWQANAHQITLELKLISRTLMGIILDSSMNMQAINKNLIEAARNGSLKNADQCITIIENVHRELTQKIEKFLELESKIIICKPHVAAIINFMKKYQEDLYASLHAIESMPLDKQMLDELVQACQASLTMSISVKKIETLKALLYSDLFEDFFDVIEEILHDSAFYEFLKDKKEGREVTYKSPAIDLLGVIGITLFAQADMIVRN